MTFAHPQLLWLLLLPAALFVGTFRRARTAAVSAHPKIPRVLLHSSANSGARATAPRTARPVALTLALAATVLALARPQGANLPGVARSNAREVLVAVDVSRSMLADDLKPDRLSRARLLIRAMLDELKGERLGLLPFAGTAFLQCPLSSDYEIFRTFLDELGPEMIPAGGSDFAALLNTAADAFSKGDADRYLIVLSDGEAQDESWRAPAEALAKRGVRILALGLGTSEGAMVPDGKGGLVKDQRGAAVLSRLDASTLRELARVTGGEYRDATAFVDLPAMLRATIAQGRAGQFEETDATRRVELFPWFLAPALLLLAYALWREFPPVPSPRKTQLHSSAARIATRATALAFALYLSFLISHSSFAAEPAAAPAPDPLVALVGQLATAPDLAPADLARLADLTASRGEAARAASKPLPDGALHDALAAIDSGSAAAPSAADWPALRKRIETLLTPPPQPPKPDTPPKNDKSEKKPSDSKEKSDSSSGSPDQSSQSSDSKSSDQKSSDSQSKSDDKSNSSDSKSSSPSDSSSKSSDDNSSASAPDPSKAPADKPLSSLSDPSKPKDDDSKSPSDSAAAASPTPPPASPPDPSTMQQAGGVAAEGTSPDSASDPASLNPALTVPRQRLEGVRASDSPARLYQLLNDSETPPDAAKRSAAGRKHDW